jgi:C4-dicarboxylate-specific signal transduction histidine kinase
MITSKVAAKLGRDFARNVRCDTNFALKIIRKMYEEPELTDFERKRIGLLEQFLKHMRDNTIAHLAVTSSEKLEQIALSPLLADLRPLLEKIADPILLEEFEFDDALSLAVVRNVSQAENILLTLTAQLSARIRKQGSEMKSRLRVSIKKANNENHLAFINIEAIATGCRIDPETADHLFEPFFESDQWAMAGFDLAHFQHDIWDIGGSIGVDPYDPQGLKINVLLMTQ